MIIQSISGNNQDIDEALYWAAGLACSQILVTIIHAHVYLGMELAGTDIKSATLTMIFKKVILD